MRPIFELTEFILVSPFWKNINFDKKESDVSEMKIILHLSLVYLIL